MLKDRFQAQGIGSEGLSYHNSRDGVDIVGPGYLDNPVLDLVPDFLVVVFQPIVPQPDCVDVVVSLCQLWLLLLIHLD